MADSYLESVLRYRTRAERIRVTAQAVHPNGREVLLALAAEFDSLASASERAGKTFWAKAFGEKRITDRRRVFKGGKIVFNQGGSVIDCTVRNISKTGALVSVLNAVTVPQEFELHWDDNAQCCTVVWRKPDDIGVKFAT